MKATGNPPFESLPSTSIGNDLEETPSLAQYVELAPGIFAKAGNGVARRTE